MKTILVKVSDKLYQRLLDTIRNKTVSIKKLGKRPSAKDDFVFGILQAIYNGEKAVFLKFKGKKKK